MSSELPPPSSEPEKSAAEKALDDIAALCGCPAWQYPGQVVRDVERMRRALTGLVAACRSGSVGVIGTGKKAADRKCMFEAVIVQAEKAVGIKQ